MSPLFRFICCCHSNQGPCCVSDKLNICNMIDTSFVPSFNVIGQIFSKIEPEECSGKHTQLYMNTFGYSSVRIWNTLSANIKESTSLKDFKRKYLTNYFLTSNK